MFKDNVIQPDEVDGKPFIFISYSRKDEKLAQDIIRILKNNHFRLWYDMGLKAGDEWAEELGDKINKCEQFIVLMSPNVTESKYVRKEVSMAVDIKEEGNLLCVYLKETTLTPGLHLLLDNIHSIYRGEYEKESEFEKAICESTSKNTFINDYLIENSKLGNARKQLEETYKIITLIGKGGMSSVYLAIHTRTNVPVAVKYASIDNTYRGYETKSCFYNEKIILSSLTSVNCPFVPQILDWYEDENSIYIVESFIKGKTLNTKNRYSEDEVVNIALKVLDILKYIHELNIIYRDIKPDNLIKNDKGEIFILDFGISRKFTKFNDNESAVGTVGYAPPEQSYCSTKDTHTDFSSDIYALGKTMEYLLSPSIFDNNKDLNIRVYRPDISVELEFVLKKMTSYFQEDRYKTVDEMINVLKTYKNGNFFKRLYLKCQSDINIKRSKKQKKQKYKNTNSKKTLVNQTYYHTAILADEFE